jgi:hypothetical protein
LIKKQEKEIRSMSGKNSFPIRALLILVCIAVLAVPAQAQGEDPAEALKGPQRAVLQQYAADTWQSFVALVEPATGLPADNVSAEGVRSGYTSPTNIGVYIWSTLAARDLGIIKASEAMMRLTRVLDMLETMERHEPSGMFYNWYDPATGAKLTIWPVGGGTVYPFLSSVDNGWLASALLILANTGGPRLRDRAWELLQSMDFGCYYDPLARGPDLGAGLIRGGFWRVAEAQPGTWPIGDYCGMGEEVAYTGHHYGALNTEPRIASYIGIALGQIPPEHYFAMWRTFPETCDWGWVEMDPDGVTRTYLGIEVYEGHYRYRGMNLVPSWGGSMFEALMVPLLVPEEEWGAGSWGVNHPLYVQAQIEHGLEEADYGYWGFSPSNNPEGGYREFGVDAIGMEPNGYASDLERTHVDYGFRDPSGVGYCPGREPQPLPTDYGQGVVTPHAAFLALDFAPEAALANLANLRTDFESYSWGGFFDAVNVSTGEVSEYYLALDQGMIMASLHNALRNDRLQHYFSHGVIQKAIQPLLAMEEFTAGPAEEAQSETQSARVQTAPASGRLFLPLLAGTAGQ